MLVNSGIMSETDRGIPPPPVSNHSPAIGGRTVMAIAHSIAAHERFSLKDVDRFWSKVLKLPSGCWEWQATRDWSGYGRFSFGGRPWQAHRVAWELTHNRAIPDALQLDHVCRNRGCVNPDHLEAVTVRVNVLRGLGPTARYARRTHCAQGHPFTGDNFKLNGSGRRCRLCMKQKAADRRQRFIDFGLCSKCGSPSATYRCDTCRKQHAAESRKSYTPFRTRNR